MRTAKGLRDDLARARHSEAALDILREDRRSVVRFALEHAAGCAETPVKFFGKEMTPAEKVHAVARMTDAEIDELLEPKEAGG